MSLEWGRHFTAGLLGYELKLCRVSIFSLRATTEYFLVKPRLKFTIDAYIGDSLMLNYKTTYEGVNISFVYIPVSR